MGPARGQSLRRRAGSRGIMEAPPLLMGQCGGVNPMVFQKERVRTGQEGKLLSTTDWYSLLE